MPANLCMVAIMDLFRRHAVHKLAHSMCRVFADRVQLGFGYYYVHIKSNIGSTSAAAQNAIFQFQQRRHLLGNQFLWVYSFNHSLSQSASLCLTFRLSQMHASNAYIQLLCSIQYRVVPPPSPVGAPVKCSGWEILISRNR